MLEALPDVPSPGWSVDLGRPSKGKKRIKTGVSEELRLFLAAPCRPLNGKARSYFRSCNPANTSSRLKKTWNKRPAGDCHIALV